MKLVLITGMSGAGKSVALKTLEDAGYEAIDNIPLSFLPSLATVTGEDNHLAVGLDIRSRDFSPDQFLRVIESFRQLPQVEMTLIYLDCDDEVLRRRFTETRRKHPLAGDRPVLDGIQLERRLIGRLQDAADYTIDTSNTLAADLRRIITGHVSAPAQILNIHVMSFSFRQGLPREADMVIDVRFLKNPHYVESLSALTGQDAEVGAYIESDPGFAEFFQRLQALLLPLLPRYRDEGKSYFTLAIGCTGGKHRSVYIAQKLDALIHANGYPTSLHHRDLAVG